MLFKFCLFFIKNGESALHLAVTSGNVEIVKILIEQGCDVNAQTIDGITPLFLAQRENNVEIIGFLLENGASKSLPTSAAAAVDRSRNLDENKEKNAKASFMNLNSVKTVKKYTSCTLII